jgi:hypothetical protein
MNATPKWVNVTKGLGVAGVAAIFLGPRIFPRWTMGNFAMTIILAWTVVYAWIAMVNPRNAAYFTRNPDRALTSYDASPRAMAIATRVGGIVLVVLASCFFYFAYRH